MAFYAANFFQISGVKYSYLHARHFFLFFNIKKPTNLVLSSVVEITLCDIGISPIFKEENAFTEVVLTI
jgi:hypothetical protein